LKEIVKQFISQIEQDQKLLPSTKIAYKSDLLDLLDYIFDTNTEVSSVNQPWVKGYLKHLEETNLEKNSFNRRASTFRTFLKFLYRNKLAPSNYSLIVNNKSTFLKSNNDDLDMNSIEKSIEENKLKVEERLILLMIGRLGITATQIISLKTFQVDFENKVINISDTEKIDLPFDTFDLLREYLIEIRVKAENSSNNLNLFLNEKGESITEGEIYRLVKKLSADLHFQGKGKLTTRRLKKLSESKTDFLSMQRELLSVSSPNKINAEPEPRHCEEP
jgi:site-specific recombinase XerD